MPGDKAGLRRAAREAAMRIMYSMEFSGQTPEAAATDYWAAHKVGDAMRAYATQILDGVAARRAEIDAVINGASDNWPLARMAAVDRNILRVAAYELMQCPDVPTAVAINEAVEIAKQYAAPETASFINGILGKIEKEVRKEQ